MTKAMTETNTMTPLADQSLATPIFDRTSWAQLLEDATREVFEIMLGTSLNACDPVASPRGGEFTALVGLAGNLCGVLSIRCSNQSACTMASKMLGVPAEEVGDDSFDALGEIANMIAGNFKGKLAGVGNHCMLSVPTIIVGTSYRTHSISGGITLEAFFDFDRKPFWVTLELHE